jgi:outer membrane protein TolC
MRIFTLHLSRTDAARRISTLHLSLFTFHCLLLFCAPAAGLRAQLTLDGCRAKARANYPLIRQYGLIEQAKAYDLSRISKTLLPVLQLRAQAGYQSDVPAIPLALPGLNVPKLPNDQYRFYLEADQTLWDGGAARAQKKNAGAGAEVEKQQLETDLHDLEARISRLFFGILLLDARQEQNRTLQEQLAQNAGAINGLLRYGMTGQAGLDAVNVEQLNARQEELQIRSAREAYADMLSYMTGEKIDARTVLLKPDVANDFPASDIRRPELRRLESERILLDTRKDLLHAARMPKLSLFVQGGIGNPALNMFANSWDFYALGGIRLAWNFGALYTRKSDLGKIETAQSALTLRRELFRYNLNLDIIREQRDIARLRQQIEYDDEIIALRESIRKSAEARLAGGTATVTDLMREISLENLARITRLSREIELLETIYRLKHTTNNK